MKVPSEDQKAKITELDQNIKEQERLLKSAEKKMKNLLLNGLQKQEMYF